MAASTSRHFAPKSWRFADILREQGIAERFAKVRKYFFLRESTYDMTSRCNLRCDGCYYYEGEKQFTPDVADPEAWRALMRQEKERGITFVVLAGAEPALVPELLKACYDEIPFGCIATNGIKAIHDSIGYRIHVSVWGNDATSERTRNAKRMLERQVANYGDDPRAVFVYTYTKQNIDESRQVIDQLCRRGCKCTFNMFSAPAGYEGPLRHDAESRLRTRETMLDLLRDWPDHVIYSPYGAVAHTHSLSLHGLFGCSYPRCNSSEFGLGHSFRQVRSDLTWERSAACCVPDTDCADCRHYAAGSAVVTARMHRHASNPETFCAWLDYVDAYLAVWVMNYEKGHNLCPAPIAPPGFPQEGEPVQPKAQ